MSESSEDEKTGPEIGCSGKPPFGWLRVLQREIGGTGKVWADAATLPPVSQGLVSIDTVVVRDSDLSKDVIRAILHAANDIFAAGGEPTSFSLSLTLSGRPTLDSLRRLSRNIFEFSSTTRIEVGKIHTTLECHVSRATVAIVGKVIAPRVSLPRRGLVWLIDNLALSAVDLPSFDSEWRREALHTRRFSIENLPGVAKDISGDGLAGAAYQLAEQNQCDIFLELDELEGACGEVPLDSCTQDRNYGDFADRITGFRSRDRARLRAILFEPQFFGPLLILSAMSHIAPALRCKKIGTFSSGTGQLAVV
jgi:hypothetical protein